jgi:DNA-binding protein YbaB
MINGAAACNGDGAPRKMRLTGLSIMTSRPNQSAAARTGAGVFDESGLEQQLRDARASLREVSRSASPTEPKQSVAESAEGRIRVTLGTDGRVDAIEIHPTVLRAGTDYLATELRAAVNAALDGRDDDTGTAEPVPDLTALNATIERLQDEGIRQMREIRTSISDVMRKLHRS